MQACLDLAELASGHTAPNPMVGSIVLDAAGNIAGHGFHHGAGTAHAEVIALERAGTRAKGGTIYVSLEPCCHFGRTPPCTDKIIASGIKTVVTAVLDPNPLVAGGGIAKLRQAGIEVIHGVLAEPAAYLNRAFFKTVREKSPWLILKMASTLDGRIGDRDGKSRWITSEQSRAYVHLLRAQADCVLIGGNTAIADNPELIVRNESLSKIQRLSNNYQNDNNNSNYKIDELPAELKQLLEEEKPLAIKQPFRAILDTKLKCPAELKVFQNLDLAPTALFTSKVALARQNDTKAGNKNSQSTAYPNELELIEANLDESGEHLNLKSVLAKLADKGILSVLCEGGGHLAAQLLRSNLVDEVKWFIAPKLLLDKEAKAVLALEEPISLEEAIGLNKPKISQLGDDILLSCLLK